MVRVCLQTLAIESFRFLPDSNMIDAICCHEHGLIRQEYLRVTST